MPLNRSAIAGRIQPSYARRSTYERRSAVLPGRRLIGDIHPLSSKPTKSTVAPKHAPALATPKQQTTGLGRRVAATAQTSPFLPRTSRTKVLKRQLVQATAGKPKKQRRSLKKGVLTALSVLLFLFGIGVGVSGLRTNHKVEAQVRHLSQQASASAADGASAPSPVPSETAPRDSLASYKVAATLPRALRIDSIGVAARVLRTTVNTKNQLGSPSNVFDTAWYDGSAKPGEAGAVLIDGHVSGPTQHGVFYSLKQLKKGNKVSLERGDGKIFTYTVVDMRVYDADKVDMAAALTPIAPGKPGLNLITCTGKISSSGTDFVQRLVVFTSQD